MKAMKKQRRYIAWTALIMAAAIGGCANDGGSAPSEGQGRETGVEKELEETEGLTEEGTDANGDESGGEMRRFGALLYASGFRYSGGGCRLGKMPQYMGNRGGCKRTAKIYGNGKREFC